MHMVGGRPGLLEPLYGAYPAYIERRVGYNKLSLPD